LGVLDNEPENLDGLRVIESGDPRLEEIRVGHVAIVPHLPRRWG
jgi:hypothetical protein